MDFNNYVLASFGDALVIGLGLVLLLALVGYGVGTCLKLVFKMV